jgi:hypothetical protein
MEHVISEAKITRAQARYILFLFCKLGLIKKVWKKAKSEKEWGKQRLYTITYRLADLKKMTERIAPKAFESTAQDRMWFVIRKLRMFTRRDLVVLTCDAGGHQTVAWETARWFTKRLRKNGYIRPGHQGEWILIDDPGPKRPRIKYAPKNILSQAQESLGKPGKKDIKYAPF